MLAFLWVDRTLPIIVVSNIQRSNPHYTSDSQIMLMTLRLWLKFTVATATIPGLCASSTCNTIVRTCAQ
jgi:hypothetical protein